MSSTLPSFLSLSELQGQCVLPRAGKMASTLQKMFIREVADRHDGWKKAFSARHLASFDELTEELYPARELKPNSCQNCPENTLTICSRSCSLGITSKSLQEDHFSEESLLGGLYVAQTISLSLGALGVNNVIAAVLCALSTEYATRFYYSRTTVTR